jgi:hypothetical protein
MSGKNWEAEDGMGFAGMVPTLAEKRQDEYEQRQRDRMRTLESQVSTLQATNTTLQRELEGKTRLAQLGIDSTARRNKEIAELKATNAALIERLAKCADAVPTSWLDDILTGPNAVIGEQPWGCPEVERILSAVRKRLAALAASAGERKGEG